MTLVAVAVACSSKAKNLLKKTKKEMETMLINPFVSDKKLTMALEN
jgi:hypothetical protein